MVKKREKERKKGKEKEKASDRVGEQRAERWTSMRYQVKRQI